MARIKWAAAFESGVPAIDAQHMEMFERTNALMDACSRGLGREQMSKALDFLAEYCQDHFKQEEEIMQHNAYPLLKQHMELHAHLTNLVGELRTHMKSNAPSVSDVIILAEALSGWLVDHIGKEDQKVFRYLHEQKWSQKN